MWSGLYAAIGVMRVARMFVAVAVLPFIRKAVVLIVMPGTIDVVNRCFGLSVSQMHTDFYAEL